MSGRPRPATAGPSRSVRISVEEDDPPPPPGRPNGPRRAPRTNSGNQTPEKAPSGDAAVSTPEPK
eukprot:CAMPEP_0204362954 /NCGR_PEP_ID=MMETSP0469-20131031/40003_1 /ASSEMBLY_ACC=CAM_ASM_000384 /TAXON_ID=2969 /ORGANISM="Oxyrrhis marina" /LENGTH=64 /DNA_ID=CAMNT_0051351633 /DNA_START=23 /DNA_END=214 /DNA_ORIENTATION=-